VLLSALTCHTAVGAGVPVDVALKLTDVLLPPVLQPATSAGFEVTTGGSPNDYVPDPLPLQPVDVLVIVTLYVPGIVAVKLATLPGFVAPAGTVHA